MVRKVRDILSNLNGMSNEPEYIDVPQVVLPRPTINPVQAQFNTAEGGQAYISTEQAAEENTQRGSQPLRAEDILAQRGYNSTPIQTNDTVNGHRFTENPWVWTGESIWNTLNRFKDIAAGFVEGVTNFDEAVAKPLEEYAYNKALDYYDTDPKDRLKKGFQLAGQVGEDVVNNFLVKPIYGSDNYKDVINTFHPEIGVMANAIKNGRVIPNKDDFKAQQETAKRVEQNLIDHVHGGGVADATMALAPGKVLGPIAKVTGKAGSLAMKGIDKAAKSSGIVGDVAKPVANTLHWIEDIPKNYQARKEIRQSLVDTKIETGAKFRELKNQLLNVYKQSPDIKKDLETLFSRMEKVDKVSLSELPERLEPLKDQLVPIFKEYNNIVDSYGKAVPGRVLEITQAGVRAAEADGINVTNQAIQDLYEKNGFFDYGNYVDKTTGKVIQEGDFLNALTEGSSKNPAYVPKDLANVDFEIPLDNLERLAMDIMNWEKEAHLTKNQALMNKAIAGKQFFDDYVSAYNEDTMRVSHGLAKPNKVGLTETPRRAKVDPDNPLFTERVYGNSPIEEVARQWYEPDNIFKAGLNQILRNKTLDSWFKEYNVSKPIMSKNATAKDIVYMRKDWMNSEYSVRDWKKIAKTELPKDADPNEWIAIDKYSLNAYKDIFFPKNFLSKDLPILSDISKILKQSMLAAGTYLGANFIGGVHNFLTHSNVHLIEDITSAIKTRGALSKSLSLQREIPWGKGEQVTMATNPNKWYGKALRKWSEFNKNLGGDALTSIDAYMQNLFAEMNAHTAFRKMGVKFEDRNYEWLKANKTKAEVYDALSDIEKMSLIYGEETLIPKPVLDFLSIGSPFIRWADQATISSAHALAKNPGAYAFVQGNMLGRMVWDENEARAKGLGISNPQHGKIYKIDPKTGQTKVTETEVIPVQTTLRFLTNPMDLTSKAANVAVFRWLFEGNQVKDKYGRLKKRSNWGDIIPDYQRKVRYKNGLVTDSVEADEQFAQAMRSTVPVGLANTMRALYFSLVGQPSYQPYNDQIFVGPQGDPSKPYSASEVMGRLGGSYTRNAIQGVDDVLPQKRIEQLNRNQYRRDIKDDLQKAQSLQEMQEQRRATAQAIRQRLLNGEEI